MASAQIPVDGLAHRFQYHPPKDDTVVRAHQDIRQACFAAAVVIDGACPDGREKALAVTKLEEAMMWANAAIARDPANAPDGEADGAPQ